MMIAIAFFLNFKSKTFFPLNYMQYTLADFLLLNGGYFSVEDPCREMFPNTNCSHICKLEDMLPVCYCPIGYILGTDNETCIGKWYSHGHDILNISTCPAHHMVM